MDVRALALLVLVVASIASAISHRTAAPVKVVEASPDYVPITIFERSGNDLINYPVRVVLNESNFNGWGRVSSGGSDVYFTDSNGKPLYYWIESFDTTAKTAVMWVVVNVTKHGSTTVRMHYGGLNQYPEYRDPSKVFIFFDDFNTLDTNVWKIVSTTSGTVTASNGYLTFSIPSSTVTGGVWIVFNNGMDMDGFVVEIMVAQFSGFQTELYVLDQQPTGNPANYYPHMYLFYYGFGFEWGFTSNVDSAAWYDEAGYPPTVMGVGMLGSIVWAASPFQSTDLEREMFGIYYEDDPTYLDIENMNLVFNIRKYVAVGIYASETVTSATIDWIRIRKAVFPPPSAYVGTPPTVEYTKLCFKADFNGGALTYTLSWSGVNPFRSFTFEPSGQETYVPDGRGGFSLVAVDDSAGRRYGRLDVELNPIYVGFMKVSFRVRATDVAHMVRIELVGDGAPNPYYIDISFDQLLWVYGSPYMMFVEMLRTGNEFVELEFVGGFVKLMMNKYFIYADYIPYKYNIKKVSIIAHENADYFPPTEGYITFDDLSISINNNYCWATYEEGSSFHKYEIDIRSANGKELTNYPVKIVLNSTNFNHFRNIAPDGSNIFFVDQSGRPLNYWIEEIDLRNYSTITVGLASSWVSNDLTYIRLELSTGEIINGNNVRFEDGLWKADFDYNLIRGKLITKVLFDAEMEEPVSLVILGDGNDVIYGSLLRADRSFTLTEGKVNYWMRFPYIIVWVNVPYIPASGSAKIYMYCGNLRGLNIPRGENNPYKVFPFFEGFDSPTSVHRIYIKYRLYVGGTTEYKTWAYIDGYMVNFGLLNDIYTGYLHDAYIMVAFTFHRFYESYAAGAKIELGGYYTTNNIGWYCEVYEEFGWGWISENYPEGYLFPFYAPCGYWKHRPEPIMDMGSWNKVEMIAKQSSITAIINDWISYTVTDTHYRKLYGVTVGSVYTVGRVDYIYIRPYADPDPIVLVKPAPPVTTTTTSLLTVTVSFPIMFNISIPTLTAPSFQVSSPSLYTPYGLFTFLLFLGIFVIYSRVFSVAQALTVASAVCLALSLVMLGYSYVFMFLLLFALGLTLWKVLGK